MAKDLSRLQQQVKAAWDRLPLDVKAKLGLKITMANAHALAIQNKTIAAPPHPPHRELLLLHSLINDPNATLAKTALAPQSWLTYVDAEGQVHYGGVDFDYTDVGWAYCFPAMVFTDGATPPFVVGNVIQIADNTTVGLLGDWGGANAGALAAAAAAAKACDYLIHLGDVYYAGTNGTALLDPYETDNFVKVWPGKPGHSFALNSNHDMYAHATGYSLTTLPSPAFKAQGGNCFALYNKAYRIVGLDSAYYAPDNTIEDFPGYMIGSLGPDQGPQMQFLKQQISQLSAGQTLILLTHHNGLNEDGSLPAQTDPGFTLWQQVTQAVQQIPASASKNAVWYFGHVHVGAVYKTQSAGGATIYPRCCGHGCIPWGIPTMLQGPGGVGYAPNVLWFEPSLIPKQGSNYFLSNGYATLTLGSPPLKEAFFNQVGKQTWTGTVP